MSKTKTLFDVAMEMYYSDLIETTQDGNLSELIWFKKTIPKAWTTEAKTDCLLTALEYKHNHIRDWLIKKWPKTLRKRKHSNQYVDLTIRLCDSNDLDTLKWIGQNLPNVFKNEECLETCFENSLWPSVSDEITNWLLENWREEILVIEKKHLSELFCDEQCPNFLTTLRNTLPELFQSDETNQDLFKISCQSGRFENVEWFIKTWPDVFDPRPHLTPDVVKSLCYDGNYYYDELEWIYKRYPDLIKQYANEGVHDSLRIFLSDIDNE